MKTVSKPELTRLRTGETNKVLQVTGGAGNSMPLHRSTREAMVIVLEGNAVLTLDEKENLLEQGSSFIIPAGRNHTLAIKTNFKALVVMANDSEIEFVKQESVPA